MATAQFRAGLVRDRAAHLIQCINVCSSRDLQDAVDATANVKIPLRGFLGLFFNRKMDLQERIERFRDGYIGDMHRENSRYASDLHTLAVEALKHGVFEVTLNEEDAGFLWSSLYLQEGEYDGDNN